MEKKKFSSFPTPTEKHTHIEMHVYLKKSKEMRSCPLESSNLFTYVFIFKDFYLFIFRQRGREGEREGEKQQCVVASCMPPTWPTTQARALTGN